MWDELQAIYLICVIDAFHSNMWLVTNVPLFVTGAKIVIIFSIARIYTLKI